ALCRDVRMPVRLFSTTAESLEESGYFQWSIFMTESIRMEAASAAFLISSAACSSGVVGACTTSKPTSRTILKRSALLSCLGSMSRSTPFLIGGAAESADEVNIDAGTPALRPGDLAAERAHPR